MFYGNFSICNQWDFPILLLVMLGYILKRKQFLEESWFKKGNKLIFRVCLPTMLFLNIYNIETLSQINRSTGRWFYIRKLQL